MVKAQIFKKDGSKETWAYTYDALDRRIGKGFLKDGEVSGMSFPHDLSGSCQKTHYFHCYQVGIPREMTDIHGNLLWYGEYTAWGRLKKDEGVTRVRISRSDFKTSIMMKRRGCITTCIRRP